VFQVDTIRDANQYSLRETPGANTKAFSGDNFSWKLPSVSIGLDAQVAATRHFALTVGGTYAIVNGTAFMSGHAGLGVCTEGEQLAARLDGGVHWRTVEYTMEEVIVTTYDNIYGGGSTQLYVYRDNDRRVEATWYASLTLNTRSRSAPVNGFLMLSLVPHNVVDYFVKSLGSSDGNTSTHGGDALSDLSETVTMFAITPGLSLKLGSGNRLLAGVRFSNGSEINQAKPGIIITPFIQCDLLF
jgi:hypothetical protein